MNDATELHVRETDAFALAMERDPLLRSTIVAVARFDRPPDWDQLVSRIERATRLVPTFRERLVEVPLGLAPPRWVIDEDFDLSWHLRRVATPAPHTFQTVLDMARNAGMAAFDPARPLWEFTLVEGLDDGGAALVMKVHHALTDGIGGIQIAGHVVDLRREPTELGPMPPVPLGHTHGLAEQVVDIVGYNARRWVGVLAHGVRSAPAIAGQVVRHPGATLGDVGATVAALGRFVRPVTTTLSPVMTERRLQWHYDVLDVPTGALKSAARHVDGTLNDAFVGAIAGGMRRYHEVHGTRASTLRLTMPISIRADGDPEAGNRVTLVRFEVPIDIEDPVERMRAIDRLVGDLRRDRALPYSNTVAGVLNLLPAGITGGMLRHVDFLASNVPGFEHPVYMGGARLEAFYPFGPTIGSAANVTLMSYRGTCHMGITTDCGAVPDPEVFRSCLVEGFAEVVELTR